MKKVFFITLILSFTPFLFAYNGKAIYSNWPSQFMGLDVVSTENYYIEYHDEEIITLPCVSLPGISPDPNCFNTFILPAYTDTIFFDPTITETPCMQAVDGFLEIGLKFRIPEGVTDYPYLALKYTVGNANGIIPLADFAEHSTREIFPINVGLNEITTPISDTLVYHYHYYTLSIPESDLTEYFDYSFEVVFSPQSLRRWYKSYLDNLPQALSPALNDVVNCIESSNNNSYFGTQIFYGNFINCLFGTSGQNNPIDSLCYNIFDPFGATSNSDLPMSLKEEGSKYLCPSSSNRITEEVPIFEADNNDVTTGVNNAFYQNTEIQTNETNSKLENNNFKAYPNPFSNQINLINEGIEQEKVLIELIDINGNIVYISKNNDIFTTALIQSIDTSNLPNGVYFCKITSTLGSKTTKLVKRD